jgi:antibiotic biosynthesis monooxygenase (ABM) superfamily enzyme
MSKAQTVAEKKTRPPKHQMAPVIFLLLWPLAHYIPKLTTRLVADPLIAEGMTVFIMVLLMTYLILPAVSKTLQMVWQPLGPQSDFPDTPNTLFKERLYDG